jgi:hypothetical protein
MELHVEAVVGNVVTVMACSDVMCRQVRVTVPSGEKIGVADEVLEALGKLHAKVGDAAFKHKTLEDILAALRE